MEVTGDESKKKTFKGYINDIWNECMADSDKHVVTGKKPPKPDKKGWYHGEASNTLLKSWRWIGSTMNTGNYAEVGRRMGRSGSTVAKYVKLDGTPKIVKHTFKEVVREGR